MGKGTGKQEDTLASQHTAHVRPSDHCVRFPVFLREDRRPCSTLGETIVAVAAPEAETTLRREEPRAGTPSSAAATASPPPASAPTSTVLARGGPGLSSASARTRSTRQSNQRS
uniref:Uncharacterized protein n=1 Tax=Alexandrium monilatum TaxID=311494 RepID=A0A7S4VPH9_9DINO